MKSKARSQRKNLLLMGSSASKDRELPVAVKERIDGTMERGVTIIVGEASGANARACSLEMHAESTWNQSAKTAPN